VDIRPLGVIATLGEHLPLVLTQNDVSVAEIDYADVLGKVYEYPSRYRKLIQPGERFVYYRGRRRADGSSQTPTYLGCGTIGKITEIGDRFRCTVENYQEFKHPVLFRVGDSYREPEANQRRAVGFYFQVGVRPIDQRAFDKILAAGLGRAATKKVATVQEPRPKADSAPTDAEDKVLDLALTLATAEAKSQWPEATIFRAPAGQYYSLIVRHADGRTHHVAVKATAHEEPRIRLSSGEVTYADRHAANYSLWVFYAMDVEAGAGRLIKRTGRVTDDDVDLKSAVHGGRLRNVKTGKMIGAPLV
jgi:hypothetical protein